MAKATSLISNDSAQKLNPLTFEYWGMLLFLIGITVLDSVLIAILMYKYGDRFSIFINQGTAFVYGSVSIPIVLWRSRIARAREVHAVQDEAPAEDGIVPLTSDQQQQPRVPWYVLVTIGIMNGLGNTCAALGQPHTKGAMQALFNLAGIPVVMGCSWLFLSKRPSAIATAAAALIIGGIAVGSANTFNSADPGVVTFWYSVTIFGCAQLFFAGEKVYEEVIFKRYCRLDVFVMFMWTVWTQFILGWFVMPIQGFKVFGGIDVAGIPQLVWDGIQCTAGISPNADTDCDFLNPLLFFSYCAIDYTCYAWGLYVIQRGGANLMILASAVATPLTTLAFALPIHGIAGFNASLSWYSAGALVLVLSGFGIYNRLSPEGQNGE